MNTTSIFRHTWRRFLFVAFTLILASAASAQAPRIDPAGIDGSLLLCGSYKASPEMFAKFVDLAGGAKAKIVIITFVQAKYSPPPLDALKEAAKAKEAAEPIVIDYDDARKAFPQATGLWIHVDSVSPMKAVLNEKTLVEECNAILNRGGVIGSAAAGVRYVGSRELAKNGAPCMNLLPESMIELRGTSSKLPSTSRSKDVVGYHIDPGAAMLVKGRDISVIGNEQVHVFLPAANGLPMREIALPEKRKNEKGKEVIGGADLTALRRALRDRVQAFPPKQPEPPFLEKGTLVIVGGGGSPDGMYTKLIEWGGGKDKANVVIFPTASDPIPKKDGSASVFKKAGAKKVTVLSARTQKEVESKEFLDALKEATCIWFGGGRQWRFVDCYENTKALPLMFDVLNRGGVIGGSSAGATIQGDYLARGGVFNNFDIRYEGYERGFGFLKGVAIDQHFTQRKRQGDMTQLMKVYPQYLGIGLDEATAIVVKGSTADVIGKGKAHFYDANRKVEAGSPDHEALSEGGRYDLKERKIIPNKN